MTTEGKLNELKTLVTQAVESVIAHRMRTVDVRGLSATAKAMQYERMAELTMIDLTPLLKEAVNKAASMPKSRWGKGTETPAEAPKSASGLYYQEVILAIQYRKDLHMQPDQWPWTLGMDMHTNRGECIDVLEHTTPTPV